jgi:uncharacterized protein YcfJ
MSKLHYRAALAAILSLPLMIAATSADAASCGARKTNGTLIGGIGGALLGNSISHGGGGAVVGGLGGALVGREVAKGGCKRVVYRTAPQRNATATAARAAQPAARVYYDQYGRPITTTPVSYPAR